MDGGGRGARTFGDPVGAGVPEGGELSADDPGLGFGEASGEGEGGKTEQPPRTDKQRSERPRTLSTPTAR